MSELVKAQIMSPSIKYNLLGFLLPVDVSVTDPARKICADIQ